MSLTEWVARLHREKGQVDWANPPRFAVVAIDCVAAGWATIPPDLAARGLAGVWETFVVDLHEATHCCELTPSYWLEPLEVVLDISSEASDEERDKLESEKWDYYPSDDGHYVWCSTLRAGRHGTIIDTWAPDDSADPDDQPSIDDAREMWQGNCPL